MDWNVFSFENWQFKLVCVVLIWAAYIDGKQLRVPNWMTFPMVLAGLVYNSWAGGWVGFEMAFSGMLVGLLCLLPLYAVGGMGAGDVKLMAGIGAWVGGWITFYAFAVSTVVGAFMAVWMAYRQGRLAHHYANFQMILAEWLHVKNPRELATIAAERKHTMLLLPYGIPICIGTIAYFLYAGMI